MNYAKVQTLKISSLQRKYNRNMNIFDRINELKKDEKWGAEKIKATQIGFNYIVEMRKWIFEILIPNCDWLQQYSCDKRNKKINHNFEHLYYSYLTTTFYTNWYRVAEILNIKDIKQDNKLYGLCLRLDVIKHWDAYGKYSKWPEEVKKCIDEGKIIEAISFDENKIKKDKDILIKNDAHKWKRMCDAESHSPHVNGTEIKDFESFLCDIEKWFKETILDRISAIDKNESKMI
jgi:hypothetical protein